MLTLRGSGRADPLPNRKGQVLHSVFATRAPRLTPILGHPFAYPLVSFYIEEVHTESAANEVLEVL